MVSVVTTITTRSNLRNKNVRWNVDLLKPLCLEIHINADVPIFHRHYGPIIIISRCTQCGLLLVIYIRIKPLCTKQNLLFAAIECRFRAIVGRKRIISHWKRNFGSRWQGQTKN